MATGNYFDDNLEEFVFQWYCSEKLKNSWNCILLRLFCRMLYKRRDRMLTASFLVFKSCSWLFPLYGELYHSLGMLAAIMDLLHFSHPFLARFTMQNIRFRAYFFFFPPWFSPLFKVSWIRRLQNLENFNFRSKTDTCVANDPNFTAIQGNT